MEEQASWMPVLPSYVYRKESRENNAGDMEHISLCLSIHISHSSQVQGNAPGILWSVVGE